jgi:hypothetical protein
MLSYQCHRDSDHPVTFESTEATVRIGISEVHHEWVWCGDPDLSYLSVVLSVQGVTAIDYEPECPLHVAVFEFAYRYSRHNLIRMLLQIVEVKKKGVSGVFEHHTLTYSVRKFFID